MRINEDYLDDIDIADVSSEDVGVYQRDDYKNQFLFHTTEIIKGKPASFYINGIERLHRILVVALEHLPMVQDFDSHFNIVIGKNVNRDPEFVYNAKGSFDICFPQSDAIDANDYFDTSVVKRSTSLSFSIGMDVNLHNLESIRRFLLVLQRTFDTAFEKIFGKGGYLGIKMQGEKRDARMEISTNDVFRWEHRSEDWWGVFTRALKAARPDLSSKAIAEEVDRFIHSNYKSDADDLLRKFRDYRSKTWADRLIYASERIDVSDEGVLQFHLNKPLSLNKGYVDIFKEVMNKVPFKIIGCERMTYDPGGSVYTHMSDFESEIKWLLGNAMDSVGLIILKMDGNGAADFAGRIIDLTKTFPGQKIMFLLTSKEALYSRRLDNGNECVVPQHSFRFTVKSSGGQKMYTVKVNDVN